MKKKTRPPLAVDLAKAGARAEAEGGKIRQRGGRHENQKRRADKRACRGPLPEGQE